MTPGEFLTEAVLQKYSRREIVKRGVALGFSVPIIGAILAACGGGDDDDDGGGSDTEATATTSGSDAAEPTATTASDSGEATEEDGAEESTEESGGEESTEEGGDEPTSEDSGSSGGGAMEASGSIVMSMADEPLTLENWNGFSIYGHPIIRNVMEAFTNRDPETNELVPELAVSWERIDDLTWHFVLREGVTFHNGEVLNAEVAAYGMNYTWAAENAFEILALMGPQISAEAVDEYTVAIMTAEPDPILPTRLYFAPLPSMTQLEEDRESAKDNPIGTGPYTFVEWAKGQHVRLTANPDWWGHGGEDPYGTVTIKDVEIQFRTESTVRAAQITTGEAQVTHNLSAEDCMTVPVCETVPSIETLQLRLDTMNPVLADVRVREAIALAIDLEAATEQIYVGSIPATQNYGPMAVGHNEDLEIYPFDMDRAAELVEEAAADGVPVDQQLTVVATGAGPGDTEFIQYVAAQLGQIGLNVQSQIMESAQYRPEVYGTAQQDVSPDRGWIVLNQHGNELMDAHASLARYYTCDPESDSTFCNEELTERIHNAADLEGEEREQVLEELGAAIYEQYAIIPIAYLGLNYGMVEELNWMPRQDGFMLVKQMSYA